MSTIRKPRRDPEAGGYWIGDTSIDDVAAELPRTTETFLVIHNVFGGGEARRVFESSEAVLAYLREPCVLGGDRIRVYPIDLSPCVDVFVPDTEGLAPMPFSDTFEE